MNFSTDEENTAQHYSNRLHKWINEYEKPGEYPFTRIRLNRILNYLNTHNIARKNVLDVGCGVGTPTLKVTETGGSACGFDLSEELISYAQKQSDDYEVEALFHVGSALDVNNYPDKKFDLVMALGVFQHIDNDKEVFTLMKNCLADNGLMIVSLRNPLFAFSSFNRPSYELYKEIFKEFLASQDQDILDTFLKEKFDLSLPLIREGSKNDPGLDNLIFKYHNPLTIKELLYQVGLKVIDIDFYRHHALPPLLSSQAPETFEALSLQLDNQANDWRAQFLCSTYLVYCHLL